MKITSALVKELRTISGLGILYCKKALIKANGNIDHAIKIMREDGKIIAKKRSHKISSEGILISKINNNKRIGCIVEINCETDFVSKNNEIYNYGNLVADYALSYKESNVSNILLYKKDGIILKDIQDNLVVKTGENIIINNIYIMEAKQEENIFHYSHNKKISTLVSIKGKVNSCLGKDIAMHILAMNPMVINSINIPKTIINNEKLIYEKQILKINKPKNILQNIINGKIEKFKKTVSLLDQHFIKDQKIRIRDLLVANKISVEKFHTVSIKK